MKSFTKEEINELITDNRIIIIANDKVYDATEFLNRHPGGKFVLNSAVGKISDKHFNMHPEHAKQKWALYQIGVLKNEQATGCTNCVII